MWTYSTLQNKHFAPIFSSIGATGSELDSRFVAFLTKLTKLLIPGYFSTLYRMAQSDFKYLFWFSRYIPPNLTNPSDYLKYLKNGSAELLENLTRFRDSLCLLCIKIWSKSIDGFSSHTTPKLHLSKFLFTEKN